MMDELRLRIFNAIKNDLGVMAEHGDDEESLLLEIFRADEEIIKEYANTFLYMPFC